MPYLLSSTLCLIQVLVIWKKYDLPYLYGGIDSPHSYLDMRKLDSGSTVCFVRGYAFWLGVVAPYAISMAFVIVAYASTIHRIRHTTTNDRCKIQNMKTEASKLFYIFFSIGVCWLFLAFSFTSRGLWSDYIFVIFKCLQSVVLLFSFVY